MTKLVVAAVAGVFVVAFAIEVVKRQKRRNA